MALSVWQGTIADKTGRIKPGAVLLISDEEHGDLAAVYKDRAGAEPWPAGVVTADGFGFARFYAEAGRYRIQSLALGIDWRDVELGFQDTDQLRLGDGNAGTPAISFASDTDTGIYRVAPNQLGIGTNGQARVAISDGRAWFGVPLQAPAGSAAAPAISYSLGTTTGIYWPMASQMGIATSGVLRVLVGVTQTQIQNLLALTNGTPALPALCLISDPTTGIYGGPGFIGVSLAGTASYGMNAGALYPMQDNSKALGGSSNRWTTVYATTGSINTSDEREKTEVAPMTAAEIAAARDLAREIGTFRWLASIEEKGDAARTHVGLTVQGAIEIMLTHGLDPFAYAFICLDEWEADDELGIAAGERYAFRPDQLNLFIARGLEARLTALEEALEGT